MGTINQVKQSAEADTPLLFFECILPSGDSEYWSTHSIEFNGQAYSARVLKHDLFDLQLSSDDAMDGISKLSLTLANADSAISELNAAIGLKGTQLTVYFAFADLPSGTITTESTVLFRGIAGDPDLITEDALTLSFSNKLSLQRLPLPEVRIQRSCPWNFPTSASQRTEAKDGGALGRFSRLYRCGYSADISGGAGNLNVGAAYTSCDKSRSQCTERGMFSQDALGNLTRRFGAFEFVPSAINVRTAGDKTTHLSPLLNNAAVFNDPVPLVYGTGWLKSPLIFARNDGNLTHMEVLLGIGTMQGVLKVVVNDVEIPQVAVGKDMTTTGWYTPVTTGMRQGNFNLDFVDAEGNPLGDPYGSLCVFSVVVPNRISSGKSLPNVEVLLQGEQIDSYNSDASFQAYGVYKQSCLGNSRHFTALRLVYGGLKSGKLCDIRGFLRRAHCYDRSQRQPIAGAEIRMQSDSEQETKRRNSDTWNTRCFEPDAALWRNRSAGTPSGDHDCRTAACFAGWQ